MKALLVFGLTLVSTLLGCGYLIARAKPSVSTATMTLAATAEVGPRIVQRIGIAGGQKLIVRNESAHTYDVTFDCGPDLEQPTARILGRSVAEVIITSDGRKVDCRIGSSTKVEEKEKESR